MWVAVLKVQQFAKPQYKRRKEKVQKIKLQEHRECWVCGTTQNLEEHHAYGAANRPLSEKYGLKAYFCHDCHNENIPGRPGIHFNKPLRLKFKQYSQAKFTEVYGHDYYMKCFMVDYIKGYS
jgi:hypothetical protein